MGAIQSSINRLIGTAGAAAALSKKLGESDSKKESGVDAKMAAKARRVAQQKIKAITSNKEISNKAKTRRVGKAMDEYAKSLGGNK